MAGSHVMKTLYKNSNLKKINTSGFALCTLCEFQGFFFCFDRVIRQIY